MIPFITKLPVKSLKKYEIVCCILACILGVLFHFVYEFSGQNALLGLFVPVNEAVWEHLKLIFYPILLMSLAEYFIFKINDEGFFCIKLKAALLGMASTIIIYYTYSGIIGQNLDFVNIAIYFISMIISYVYSYNKIKKEDTGVHGSCLLIWGIIMLIFAYLTILPLPISLFQPPKLNLLKNFQR